MLPNRSVLFLLLVWLLSILAQNVTEIEEVEEASGDFEGALDYNSTDFLAENGTDIDVFDNSTEKAIENSTLAPNANSTSKNISVVSTTTAPTTTTVAPIHFPQRAVGEIVCTCDLQIGICDVNCCCDDDCSKFDLSAFPQCHKSSQGTPVQECDTNGFLCIFKDNMPERLWLTNPKIPNTLKEFELMSKRSNKWNWPEQEISSTAKFHPKSKYKADDIIWSTRDNATIKPLTLPMLGKQCAKNATVLFLQEVSVVCSLPADHPILKRGYFNGLRLLADSSVPIANQSEPWITVKTLYCQENATAENCTETANTSKLMVKRIQFQIYHNGSQGISSAKILTWLEEKQSYFRPSKIALEVKFWWKDEQRPVIKRSGSPGYLPGLPILTGVLSNNKTTVTDLGTFNLASSDRKGSCTHDRNILFGEDVLVTCELVLNRTGCFASEIISSLAGRHLSAVAGSFGDSEEGTLKDWLSILVKEQPPSPITNCNRAPTSLSIQILWAKVGSLENPQNKLTGMMISFGGSKVIEGEKVTLVSSVTFKEVTTGLKGLFAPPPKYEIRLPSDFFYPLFNSACSVQQLNVFLMLLSVFFHVFK